MLLYDKIVADCISDTCNILQLVIGSECFPWSSLDHSVVIMMQRCCCYQSSRSLIGQQILLQLALYTARWRQRPCEKWRFFCMSLALINLTNSHGNELNVSSQASTIMQACTAWTPTGPTHHVLNTKRGVTIGVSGSAVQTLHSSARWPQRNRPTNGFVWKRQLAWSTDGTAGCLADIWCVHVSAHSYSLSLLVLLLGFKGELCCAVLNVLQHCQLLELLSYDEQDYAKSMQPPMHCKIMTIIIIVCIVNTLMHISIHTMWTSSLRCNAIIGMTSNRGCHIILTQFAAHAKY